MYGDFINRVDAKSTRFGITLDGVNFRRVNGCIIGLVFRWTLEDRSLDYEVSAIEIDRHRDRGVISEIVTDDASRRLKRALATPV